MTTTATSPARMHLPAATTTTVLEVVVPVYNEQDDLAESVRRLHAYLTVNLPYPFSITIADNASTDLTLLVAEYLAGELAEVQVLHLPEKGRGRALHTAWSRSDAPVLAYMDVDLSTDLAALLPLIAPLISGHSDVAIGSRLARSARVVRGPKREVISRCYNLLLHRTLATRFSDAQCGFKAIRGDVARRLLPLVEDTGWFFDTELLVLAERAGLRIHEVPVDWVDDADSRVDILSTAKDDLKGVLRVGRALASGRLPLGRITEDLGRLPGVPVGMVGQLMRFAVVGVFSTLAYLVLFAALRTTTGTQSANLVALLLTAVVNTAVNRRVTFRVATGNPLRQQAQGLAVFLLALAVTSGSLALLAALVQAPSRHLELVVVIVANAIATLLRFVLLRAWVFRTA
jgi:putative flippase GtrA/glycosyltransferase involved in cell wall biosynthesis